MRKNLYSIIVLFAANLSFGQVGINTSNPQTTFNIDGKKDNPLTGAPTAAQGINDFVVTEDGNVGVGKVNPASKVEINSGTANTSGLQFTNFTSASPVSSGATLGVDATGKVVTVQGSSFSPAFGRVVLGGTYNLAANATNYNLLNFTLPSAGTYLITYSVRGEIQFPGGYGYLVSSIYSAPSAGNIVDGTEILIVASNDASRQVIGGTGTGTLIVTVTAPKTYYVTIKSTTLPGTVFDNQDGRTSVSYVKVTP